MTSRLARLRAGSGETRIGDSIVMVSSVGLRHAMLAFLYLYVEDIDATSRRALEAGAMRSSRGCAPSERRANTRSATRR